MHVLNVGMTESGKSTLGKILARQLHAQGKRVVILDPLYDPDWQCSDRFPDVESFAAYLRANRSCFGFVDECGAVFDDGNDSTHSWLATRSRHYGHSLHFMAQRAIQLPKTMRDQCARVFLFTSSASDGKILAEEWNKPILQTCNTLPKLEFFMAERYDMCSRMRIVNYTEVHSVAGELGNNGAERGGNNRNRAGSGEVPRKDGKT
jgi:hypothetical protein